MKLFVSVRRWRIASPRIFGSRILGRSAAGISVGLFLISTAGAQVSNPHIPDAPAPNSSALKASLSNNPAPLENVDSPAAGGSLHEGDLSLYTVVDLALRNSHAVRIAEAEQRRTQGYSMEMRDAYIPNFALGGGPGYSYGFPLGTPTLFNITSNSLLFSFSQHDYIRSSRAAVKAATLSLKNTRQQVILDTALNYIELSKTLGQIDALNEAKTDTDRLLDVMTDRLRAGLETSMQMTRTRLTRAQIELRTIQVEDHANELRQHLSNLTGLDASLIQPVASSIPKLPDLDFPSLLRTSANPPAVQASAATADAKIYAARGDKKQNNRPTVNTVFQYSRFSTFNNYSSYYLNFQQNNIAIGIQAVWPLFDPIRKDKAIESQAEAVHARQQAQLDRIQNDEGNLAMWHSLRELEAQEQVAVLQQQLAQDMLASTVTQMNGSTPANGAPVTPQQAEQQRIDERTSYVDLEDARFNVTKVKLDLLNAIGGLEDWAKESGQPAADGRAPSGSHSLLH